MSDLPDVAGMAQGKWRGLLMQSGLSDRELSGRHGPCPICKAGRDRFRFDNRAGKGSWICGHCGAGDGLDLLMQIKGWNFSEAAKFVEQCVGGVLPEQTRPAITAAKQREALRALWKASEPMREGDPVDVYLRGRGIDHDCPPALRYAPECYYGPGEVHPAMVAVVSDAFGKEASLHRTYLGPDGKASVETARKLMPGLIPEGGAIRLSAPARVLGIAEGVETALSAAMIYEVPVWAAISASTLEKWLPPDECEEVVVFGDADSRFRGQAAAYRLANRLAMTGREVTVRLPERLGWDWNDALTNEGKAA